MKLSLIAQNEQRSISNKNLVSFLNETVIIVTPITRKIYSILLGDQIFQKNQICLFNQLIFCLLWLNHRKMRFYDWLLIIVFIELNMLLYLITTTLFNFFSPNFEFLLVK